MGFNSGFKGLRKCYFSQANTHVTEFIINIIIDYLMSRFVVEDMLQQTGT